MSLETTCGSDTRDLQRAPARRTKWVCRPLTVDSDCELLSVVYGWRGREGGQQALTPKTGETGPPSILPRCFGEEGHFVRGSGVLGVLFMFRAGLQRPEWFSACQDCGLQKRASDWRPSLAALRYATVAQESRVTLSEASPEHPMGQKA